jgi:hypothetical protein
MYCDPCWFCNDRHSCLLVNRHLATLILLLLLRTILT